MSTNPNELLGQMQAEIKQFINRNDLKYADLEKRLDAADVRDSKPLAGGGPVSGVKTLVEEISRNRDTLNKSGRLILEVPSLLPERKATILSTGITTPSWLPAIEEGGRPEFRVRSLFRTLPADGPSVFRIRENVYTNNASPQVEGSAKTESTVTFTAETVPVETVAHYVNVSRQALEDVQGLSIFLESALIWGLEQEIETQLLFGDNSSPNLDSVTAGATAFDVTLLTPSDGYEYLDCLSAAAQQLRTAGFRCDSFIVSPAVWSKIERQKDSVGNYVVGNPRSTIPPILWGKAVVESSLLTGSQFVALDSRRFHIRERMTTTVDVSFEHASHYTSNLCCIRAEARLAFIVGREDAAIWGSLVQSPA